MAKVSIQGKEFALLFSEQEFNDLDLNSEKEYEFFKVKKGLIVGVEKETVDSVKQPIKEITQLDKKIVNILKSKDLPQRVEGKFEEFLNSQELVRFKELLNEKKVILFKLNQNYKKGVYKLKEELGEKLSNKVVSVVGQEDVFEKTGFEIVKDVARANELEKKLAEQVKANKIMGLKMDETFYLIKTDLFTKHSVKLLNVLEKEKQISLQDLAEKTELSEELVRICVEFLKENGKIIEKRKDLFKFV